MVKKLKPIFSAEKSPGPMIFCRSTRGFETADLSPWGHETRASRNMSMDAFAMAWDHGS